MQSHYYFVLVVRILDFLRTKYLSKLLEIIFYCILLTIHYRNLVAEQHFEVCPNSTEDEPHEEMGWKELYYCTIIAYLLWMAFYFIIVSI